SIAYDLDAEGTQLLAQATGHNIGKHLAIVFDGQVMSSPAIDSAITGGEGQISANFSEDGVRDQYDGDEPGNETVEDGIGAE
ncbi:hypothetical protein ACC733_38305, partial [Rhizobium johnstonii]|uniref:SecDF P1 head subdomain-containing protein n=1 Tax=Rhizobium johnstonii TaxID=3019933 RepID=UPI003F9D8BBA